MVACPLNEVMRIPSVGAGSKICGRCSHALYQRLLVLLVSIVVVAVVLKVSFLGILE